jgi:hypothetical protein
MKHYLNKSRVAWVALSAVVVAGAALAVLAAPAFGMAFSSVRIPGRGVSAPVQSSGSASPVGWIVVAAILTATVAFAVIGWRYDRRRAARAAQARQTGLVPDQPVRPSASKPLPVRPAPAVRARRDQRSGDQSHKPTI